MTFSGATRGDAPSLAAGNERGTGEILRPIDKGVAMSKKLTVKEAGEYAGVSPALIYLWCQEQRLPHYRFGSEGRRGKILIDPADLEAFMRRCRIDCHPLLAD